MPRECAQGQSQFHDAQDDRLTHPLLQLREPVDFGLFERRVQINELVLDAQFVLNGLDAQLRLLPVLQTRWHHEHCAQRSD